jgi:hypothetical protein
MIKAVTLVAISVQELRRLFGYLQKQHPPNMHFHWRWSIWRRHHQAEAKRAHYRKRNAKLQL